MAVGSSTGINFSTVKFYYKAGLYVQIKADKSTSGTIILYSDQRNMRGRS